MNQRINWSEAAKYGLFLSVITIVIEQVTFMFSLPGIVNTLLSLVKFAGSVSYLYYIVKKNSLEYGSTYNAPLFRFGLAVCTFSALVCSMFSLMTFTVFYPDAASEMLEYAFTIYEEMGMYEMDYDMLARYFPAAITVSKFLSCFIIGLIASPIIASLLKKGNDTPFTEEDFKDIEKE